LRRLAPLIAVACMAALVLAMGWHRELSLENLVRNRAALDAFVADNRVVAVMLFVMAYVTVVALSVPGALFMTLTGGVLFGAMAGGGASVIGATLGATAIFLIAKTAFGEHLARRAGSYAERLAEGFRRNAFSYLLFLRLVPLVPFFAVNLVAAVLGVRLGTFVAATVIGIIPATFAFALMGAGLDSAIEAQQIVYQTCVNAQRADCRLDFDLKAALTPELVAALLALGVIALVPVIVRRRRAEQSGEPG
jgi:uncharacterized membrane protein YdjX (TVP38/TMEM64 family)